MKLRFNISILALFIVMSGQVSAGAIEEFGRYYEIDLAQPIAEEVNFRVAFDVADSAETGSFSPYINSAARLNNMLLGHGVSEDRIQLAVVIHGSATYDVQRNTVYQQRTGEANGSAPLILALIEQGVRVIVCGQSATHLGVTQEQLIPGVEMALSAMVAHAQLQQNGYTLNPF